MEYTDARGCNLSRFSKVPMRIISLVPSQTELLFYLELDAEVIGLTKFCVHPKHWFQSKMRIGSTKNLQLDQIKKLQPDLILANKEENEKVQIEELAKDFPVWTTDVCNVEDALAMIETVGLLTDRAAKANALKTEITERFQQLKQQQNTKPVRVCYLIWKDPYLTVGGDTFINAMLQYAGFENVFANKKRYPEINIETIQEQQCEVLLLSSEPYPFNEKHKAVLQSLLPDTKIVLVDGEIFSWYGSRLLQASTYFQQLNQKLQRI